MAGSVHWTQDRTPDPGGASGRLKPSRATREQPGAPGLRPAQTPHGQSQARPARAQLELGAAGTQGQPEAGTEKSGT